MDMNEGKVGEKLGRALDDAQLVKYDEWNGTLAVWNGSVTFHAYDIETGDCVAMWTGEHQLGLDDAKEVPMMPNGKVYVTMTDKFLSGWGRAEGKINKLIFVCDSAEEAQIVFHNAESRGDMKHINMTVTKPYYSPSKYYAQFRTQEDASNWYKPNYNWGR